MICNAMGGHRHSVMKVKRMSGREGQAQLFSSKGCGHCWIARAWCRAAKSSKADLKYEHGEGGVP
eukprot:765518-Hanusia_phi.AAC.14